MNGLYYYDVEFKRSRRFPKLPDHGLCTTPSNWCLLPISLATQHLGITIKFEASLVCSYVSKATNGWY